MRKLILLCLLFVPIIMSCGSGDKKETIQEEEKKNSIYHWKTTFNLDSIELDFIEKHNIGRIYVKMFDVVIEKNSLETNIVPIATTKFITKVPSDIEIVPVTFITIDALRYMQEIYNTNEYASLMVERMLAMCSYNECGTIKELQIDCDWTATTRDTYFKLCKEVKNLLAQKDIRLSVTVRLHQLKEAAPPVDKGVLMLYNTGDLKNPDTKNSILDIANVKPYLKEMTYPIPLDFAYPCYGWGIKFNKGIFAGIVSENYVPTGANEKVRVERATASEILEVKQLVEKNIGKPFGGNILYHLDNSQLSKYSSDEINKILVY